jgi:GNAT superfamily N-acetyltransferase
MSAPAPPASAEGEALVVRRLGRGDLPAVERHLLSLGPADRRKRFGAPADDDAVAAHVSRLDPGRAVLVGAADPDGRLVGVAEALFLDGAPRPAVEVAVSVHPYHRREGLGRRLAARAVALAFAEGAEAAVSPIASANLAGFGLARSLGARCDEGAGRAVLLAAEAPERAAA